MLIAFILPLVLITAFQATTVLSAKPTQDSEELRLQDMLINMLIPYIEKDLHDYYRIGKAMLRYSSIAPYS